MLRIEKPELKFRFYYAKKPTNPNQRRISFSSLLPLPFSLLTKSQNFADKSLKTEIITMFVVVFKFKCLGLQKSIRPKICDASKSTGS